MGWGDFLSDVTEPVGNWVGGVAHGVQAIGSQFGHVAQAASWAANPTHYDDIARGAGAAANFVGDHPGQTWDIGFEVGRHLIKEELLDPKNLAINLGLTAATMATGGGAGAAWLGRMSEGAASAVRGVRAGTSALRAAKDVEEGTVAARAVAAGVRGAEEFSGVARGLRGAEEAGDVGSMMSRVDQVLSPNARMQGLQAQFRPSTRIRNWTANAIERGGGETTGLGRQMTADWVRNSATKPVFREGTSELAQSVATNAWRARRVQSLHSKAESTSRLGGIGETIYQAETHPVQFALNQAEKHGYDPLGAARKAVGKVTQEASSRILNSEGDEKKPRPSVVGSQPMAPLRQPTFEGGVVQSPTYPRTSTQTRVTGNYEAQDTQAGPITVGSRRSSFYNGIDTAYQHQSIYDTEAA